jgi:predicted flap endonuclease-1-like 5' DNA nuclease
MLAMHLLEEGGGASSWVIPALLIFFGVVILMILVGWWAKSSGKVQAEAEPVQAHGAHDDHRHETRAAEPVSFGLDAGPAEPDDLTSLEGIGPKVAKVLAGIGITTFAGLASADLAKLREALDAAGYKYMDPAGWVEQARFAAKGDADGLKKLQDSLKGGRKAG